MSGHKRETVTISQEEYRRLYEAERAALYATYTTPVESVTTNQIIETGILDKYWEDQELRNQTYQSVINELSTHLNEIETSAEKQIVNERASMLQELESSRHIAQQNAFDLVQQYTSQLETNMAQDRQALEYSFQIALMDKENQYTSNLNNAILETQNENLRNQAKLRNRVARLEYNLTTIHQRTSQLITLAQQWLKDVSTLLTSLENQYGSLFDNRSVINSLDEQYNQSVSNFQNGLYEACLVGCQSLATQISSIRNQFENRILEYKVLLQSVSLEADEIYNQIRLASTIPAIKMKQDLEDLSLNLQEWVEDDYLELLNSLEVLVNQLRNQTYPFSKEDLLNIRQELLPSFLNRLGELIDEVQVKSLNAQIRFNLAQLVLAALVTQGLSLDSCGFQNSRYDYPYELSANSSDGGRVIVRIDPIPGELFSTQLHIISDDTVERTHQECVQRAKELNRSLRQVGLQIHDQHEIKHEKSLNASDRRVKTHRTLSVS
jgi:hypothetical protein